MSTCHFKQSILSRRGQSLPVDILTRANGGSTATTAPFGSGYITRGNTAATPANSPAAGNVIILPARK
jgi:hypothetical protein